MINSRSKGCRGERALRDLLRAEGYEARRGKQYSGDESAPDVICPDLPEIHWEAKWCEKLLLTDWMAQAKRDSGKKLPVVVHKRNYEEPIASMPFWVLAAILRRSDLPAVDTRPPWTCKFCGAKNNGPAWSCPECGKSTATGHPGAIEGPSNAHIDAFGVPEGGKGKTSVTYVDAKGVERLRFNQGNTKAHFGPEWKYTGKP